MCIRDRGVGHPVSEQGVHAAVGEEDLEPPDPARRRVAVLRRGEVLAQLARHPCERPETEHCYACAATREQAGQSSRRAVATMV